MAKGMVYVDVEVKVDKDVLEAMAALEKEILGLKQKLEVLKAEYELESKEFKKPRSFLEPPLSRILRQGSNKFCKKCGSTISRQGFLGIFGKSLCDNEKCRNRNA